MKNYMQYIKTGVITSLILLAAFGTLTINAQDLSCGVNELTFTTGDVLPSAISISGDGQLAVIGFDKNPTGGNPDGNTELFLYDLSNGSVLQITNTVGKLNALGFISGNGSKIAFGSTADFTGGNGDGGPEVFLFDRLTWAFTQLTNSTAVQQSYPESISDDGSRLTISSQTNPTGNNPDGGSELFVYDTGTNQFVQITNTVAGDFDGYSEISGNGARIAIGSENDLTGGNADGNMESFLYDIASATMTQVTDTADPNHSNSAGNLNFDGTKMTIFSNGFTGGNADGNREIYLYDVTTGGISQITNTVGGNTGVASLSADGKRIAFDSDRDFVGTNADGSTEVFVYDVSSNKFTQVTNTVGTQVFAFRLSDDGKSVIFLSNGYSELGNADGNPEFFVAKCLPPTADLSIGMGADKTTVRSGDKVTYTITVSNSGPNIAKGVFVNDIMSSGATFVSAKANKGSFIAPSVGQSGVVKWNVGDMTNNSQESAQIVVTVILKRGTVTNTATVGSQTPDPDLVNNTAALTVTIGSGGGGKK